MNNKIKQKASYLPQGVTTAGGSACFVRVRCQIQALKGCMSPAGTEQVPFDFPSICVNHYTTGGSSSYTKILMGKKKKKKENTIISIKKHCIQGKKITHTLHYSSTLQVHPYTLNMVTLVCSL